MREMLGAIVGSLVIGGLVGYLIGVWNQVKHCEKRGH